TPAADGEFCAACAEVTAGNPFLVRELLAEVAGEGLAGAREDAERVREIAPAGVSRAAAVRLARLPAPARALASALAVLGAEPERVAVHLLGIEPADDAEVVESLAAAGRRAVDRAAPEAAVRYLRRALAESPPPELRREIVERLLVAGFRAADRSALDGVDALAELTADPAVLVETATPLSAWLLRTGRREEVAVLLERAARAAVEAGDIERAMLFEAQKVTWLQRPPREAIERLA